MKFNLTRRVSANPWTSSRWAPAGTPGVRGRILSVALGTALFLPSPAHAESRPAAFTNDNVVYEFEDDPLAAEGSASRALLLRVRPRGVRVTLIRPRLHFVRELLETVEDL
jgi:hypothetical protein